MVGQTLHKLKALSWVSYFLKGALRNTGRGSPKKEVDLVDRLSTISRWMAHTVAQVERAPHPLIDLFLPYFKLNGPKRSPPVTENGGEKGKTLSGGKSAIRVVSGCWSSLRQTAQSLTSFLARRLPRTIQNFRRLSLRVLSGPASKTLR